jgi:phenylalanyl-tRNA synthetase beta chain
LLPGVETRPCDARSIEHPHRSAEMVYQDRVQGRLCELHPSLVEAGRAAVLDLDLTLVEAIVTERAQPGTLKYAPLRRYPSSAFDLSVVIPARGLIGQVQDDLARFGGADLLQLVFLRDFPLPEGTRSVSFRLTVGAADGTLSTEEVGAIRSRVVEGMQGAGYELKV